MRTTTILTMQTRRTYQSGQTYSFEIIGLVNHEGSPYIEVTDGYYRLRVAPYEFQLEKRYLDQKTSLNCYVKAVSDRGIPLLTQSRLDALKERFTEFNTEYPFIVKAAKQDAQTGWLYYELKDIHGLTHRYYPNDREPQRSPDDIITLVLRSIEEKGKNKSHLNLECPNDLLIPNPLPTMQERGKFGSERERLEFKSSIVFTANGMPDIDRQVGAVARAIAGMMNKSGGRILIGIKDNGTFHGIESDFPRLNDSETDDFYYLPNKDGYENKIRNAVKIHLGATANGLLEIRFPSEGGKVFCELRVKEMARPVYFDKEKIYQRAGNTTQQLKGEDITYFMEEKILKYRASWNAMELPKEPISTPIVEVKEEPLKVLKEEKAPELPTSSPVALPEVNDQEEKLRLFYDIKAAEHLKARQNVWAYMTFYTDGNWSYQKQPVTWNDVLFQVCVTEEMKSQRLLMAYDNGHVNAVIPEEMVVSNNARGGVPREMGLRHRNGWNKTAKLIAVELAKTDDFVLLVHEESQGNPYFKVHRVGTIPTFHALLCEGTKMVGARQRWKMVNMKVLTQEESELFRLIRIPEEMDLTINGFSDRDPAAGRMIRQYKKRLLS